MGRQWEFEVRYLDGVTCSYRVIKGPDVVFVLDKAYNLFMQTWKRPPDKIDIKSRNVFTYKPN